MGREINRACELSCDEAVIRKLDTNGQRGYGDTLLNALGIGGSYKDSLASVTLTESKELLQERLNAIMKFKKKTKLISFATFLISCLLLCGFAFTGAYAASQSNTFAPLQSNSANGTTATAGLGGTTGTLGPTQATAYVIECVSEKIVVRQEGSEFKIEPNPNNQSSYRLRDNTNIPFGDRNYRYNKWDIIFERTDRDNASTVYSPTVTVTIPANIDSQELLLITNSGDIHAESLSNVRITAESQSGNIYITDTDTEYISVETISDNIELVNVTSKTDIRTRSIEGTVSVQCGDSDSQYAVNIDTATKADITINGQRYNGGNYMIGNGGGQTITLEGLNNTFKISNLSLFNSDVTNTLNRISIEQNEQSAESYWTEQEFISFMQEQEQRYKELLASGDITQSEFATFISTDKATLKEIQNGARISKSATGSIDNGIGN